MSDMKDINSRDYWEQRFHADWEKSKGREQTAFFGSLAVANFPRWFNEHVTDNSMTICDWGCALGDASQLLARHFPQSKVTGIDISREAIAQARELYPEVEFSAENLLSESRRFDVVFSSNTLEHFSDPLKVLDELSPSAGSYLVMLIPFYDDLGIDEHFFRFDWSNIPVRCGENFHLVFSKMIDASRYVENFWPGQQVMLIYAQGEARKVAERNGRVPDYPASRETLVDDNPERLSARLIKAEFDGWGAREELLRFLSKQGMLSGTDSYRMRELTIAQAAEKVTGSMSRIVDQLAIVRAELEAKTQSHNILAADVSRLRSKAADLEQNAETVARVEAERDRLSVQLSAAIDQKQKLLSLVSRKDFRIEQLKGWLRAVGNARPLKIVHGLRRLLAIIPGVSPPPSISGVLDAAADPKPGELKDPKTYLQETMPVQKASPSQRKALPYRRRYSRDAMLEKVRAAQAAGKTVFVQAPVIDWNVPLYQRPQHMATAFAKAGALVVYVTNNMNFDMVSDYEELSESLVVTSDSDFPKQVSGAVVSVYSTVAAYDADTLAAIRANGNLLVYEYIDHIDEQISGDSTERLRQQFLNVSAHTFDYVIYSGKALLKDIKDRMPEDRLVYVPNGVDLEHYQAALSSDAVHESMRPVLRKKRPIVGYFGALAPWLWYGMLEELVQLRSDMEFVFIGPDYLGGSTRLPKAENVHFLGAIEYVELADAAKFFDVAMIPFAPGDIARTTSPLKLFEYFALQKPVVVSSDMEECVDYEGVTAASNASEFADAISRYINEPGTHKASLLENAQQNTWAQRASSFMRVLPVAGEK